MNLECRGQRDKRIIHMRSDCMMSTYIVLTTLKIHYRSLKILGELDNVHCCRHNQQFQRWQVLQFPQILRPSRHSEQDVGVNGALVCLVEYHYLSRIRKIV